MPSTGHWEPPLNIVKKMVIDIGPISMVKTATLNYIKVKKTVTMIIMPYR